MFGDIELYFCFQTFDSDKVDTNDDKNLDEEIKDSESVELGANPSLPTHPPWTGSTHDVCVVTGSHTFSLVSPILAAGDRDQYLVVLFSEL